MMKIGRGNQERDGYKAACLRKSLGLSQAELAGRIGVSRQFLNLLEAGKAQPNVQVALRLAGELGCTVEDLFRAEPGSGGGEIAVNLAGDGLGDGCRVAVGRVGRRWVAHGTDSPMSLGGGFTEADGVLVTKKNSAAVKPHRGRDELENNVIVAGCDPALALLRAASPARPTPGRCVWVNRGSGRALELLESGAAHIAGIHYGGEDGRENLRRVERLDAAGKWRLVRFTRWEQGWMLRRDAAAKFRDAADLGGGKLRLANREAGSGARLWLERQLTALGLRGATVPGYEREFESHWSCAGAVAAGDADVAVGPRAVAATFGLDFVAAEEVVFDLIVPKAHLDHPRVQALLNSVRSAALRREIATLPGYGAGAAGDWVR